MGLENRIWNVTDLYIPFPLKSAADDFENIKTRIGKISIIETLKSVENIVTKREITYYEQFLLFSFCFKKSSAARASKNLYIWERVYLFPGISNVDSSVYWKTLWRK